MTPNIFFIADTHFGHKNIINVESVKPYRPFVSIEEHDEELVKRWNSVVRKQGTVWHLKDFAFGSKHIAVAGRLNGRKKLILGNHDHYRSAEYLRYFEKLYGAATIDPTSILGIIYGAFGLIGLLRRKPRG